MSATSHPRAVRIPVRVHDPAHTFTPRSIAVRPCAPEQPARREDDGELFALKNQAGAVGHSNEGRNPVANQVNLEFDTLDTPDVFWEFEEAAS